MFAHSCGDCFCLMDRQTSAGMRRPPLLLLLLPRRMSYSSEGRRRGDSSAGRANRYNVAHWRRGSPLPAPRRPLPSFNYTYSCPFYLAAAILTGTPFLWSCNSDVSTPAVVVVARKRRCEARKEKRSCPRRLSLLIFTVCDSFPFSVVQFVLFGGNRTDGQTDGELPTVNDVVKRPLSWPPPPPPLVNNIRDS